MATATKTPSPAVSAASEALASIRADREKMSLAAEEILSRVEDELHYFSNEEVEILRAAGYPIDRYKWSERLAIIALDRKKFQKQAGSAKEYAAAKSAVGKAESSLKATEENLKATIADAQRQLDTLNGALVDAQERVRLMDFARTRLNGDELLRPCDAAKRDDLQRQLQPIRGRVLNLESKLGKIDRLTSADPGSVEGAEVIRNYAGQFAGSLGIVKPNPRNSNYSLIDNDKWSERVAELKAKRLPIVKELDELRPKVAAAEAAVAECRDRLLNG